MNKKLLIFIFLLLMPDAIFGINLFKLLKKRKDDCSLKSSVKPCKSTKIIKKIPIINNKYKKRLEKKSDKLCCTLMPYVVVGSIFAGTSVDLFFSNNYGSSLITLIISGLVFSKILPECRKLTKIYANLNELD